MERLLRFVVIALMCSCTESTDSPVEPAEVESVSLSPQTAVMSIGTQQQFSVAASWTNGSTSVPIIEFTATGGTVSSTGLFTAGQTPGSFVVVATYNEEIADTAAVTLTAPSTSVVLFTEAFEDGNGTTRGWYDNTSWTISSTEHIPGSQASLELHWEAGETLPTFGGTARHLFTPSSSLYIRYWVKYSANWVGSGEAFHPHEFQILSNENDQWTGPSFTHLTTYIENRYLVEGGVPVLGMTDGANISTAQVGQDLTNVTEDRSVAGCNGNTDGKQTDCYPLGGGQYNNGKWLMPPGNEAFFEPAPGPGYKNDWHLVEVYFKINSIQGGIGQLDGVAQYWFDGQLAIDEHGLLFRTGAYPTMLWNQFIVGPYIGPGSPVSQTVWIDDLFVATGKP